MREIKKNLTNLFYLETLEKMELVMVGLVMIDRVMAHKTVIVGLVCLMCLVYLCFIVYNNIKVEKYINDHGIEDKRLILNSIENLGDGEVRISYCSDTDFRTSITLSKQDYNSYVANFGVKNKVGELEEVCIDKSGKVLDFIYGTRDHVVHELDHNARGIAMILVLFVAGTLLGI